eukprot:NODE_78_length_23131_cov_0.599427.p6 type:complete len:408 gc:universal NODE_78_length_23131_cov_0.599427:8276-9499(+)
MLVNKSTVFNGWIRAIRKGKTKMFIEVSNGVKEYQVISKPLTGLSIGSSVQCRGTIKTFKDVTEIHADSVTTIGKCDPDKYPLQGKRHKFEFLRKYPHLASRRKFQNSIFLFRDFLQFEIHKYFRDLYFVNVNTPLLTTNDCEGGGSTLAIKSQIFNQPCHLTVSAQLHLEALNSGIENVYTLSPCFRAEKTLSSKHLAEFYMLEAELGFLSDLNKLIDFVERLFLHLVDISVSFLLPKLSNLQKEIDIDLNELEKLHKSLAIQRITFDDAFKLLSNSSATFEIPLKYGNLASEHEHYLVNHFRSPIFVTHYPSSSKPFYMSSKDGKADCFDFLVPKVGELIGGSLRSNELLNVPDNLEWYNDIRRYGSIPHGGFGLGFERFIMYMLQLDSIRDTIPFPRYYKNIKC